MKTKIYQKQHKGNRTNNTNGGNARITDNRSESSVQRLLSNAIQMQNDEDELMQGKLIAQRAEDEEELMQGKMIQKVEEEELMQGKMVSQQAPEEEELMQGKLIQRAAEEEELMQGKFLQREADEEELMQGKMTTQRVENKTGMPDNLKSGVEQLSGLDMSDVRVHYNSSEPANVQAHAFTQGSDIHVASGQEQHLAHEAWHVAQQKQGRVQPTTEVAGMPVNDNPGLEHEADVMGAKASSL